MAKRAGGGRKGASIHVIPSTGRIVKKSSHGSKGGHSAKSLSRHATRNSSHKEKAWSVRTSGSSRAGRVFHTKEEALGYARDVARKHGSELYVHRRDGLIMEKDSYSGELHPPRDRRGR